MTKSRKNSRSVLKSMTALSSVAVFATAAVAQDVTLRSPDGSINLRGELLSYDEQSYVIQTAAGDITVAASEVSCRGETCPGFVAEKEYINVSGSDTVASGLMPLLLAGFANSKGAAETIENTSNQLGFTSALVGDGGFGDELENFRVLSSISSDAFANLLGGSSQIGMSSRRIRPNEVEALTRAGAGDMTSPSQEHIVALDNLVVITHPNNEVQELSMQELRAVYSGQITNWSELGGDDAPITVVQLRDGSATKGTFDERVFGGLAASVPANTVQVGNSEEVAAVVNQDDHAIGYVSFAFQRGASPMTLISDCGIEMTPDAFSARTEEYALNRFLYLYTRADNRGPNPMEFVNYVTSPAADTIVSKSGFIDLGITHREQAMDSQRAAMLQQVGAERGEARLSNNMLNDMANYDRLSSTFRFETGSDRLTPRGEVNMERLVAFVETLPAGTKIKFVGFTDSVGAFENNRILAENRAQQVMATLRRAAGSAANNIEMDSIGYSEVAPVGCNSDEAGRAANRRVEVWIESGVL